MFFTKKLQQKGYYFGDRVGTPHVQKLVKWPPGAKIRGTRILPPTHYQQCQSDPLVTFQ